MLVRCTWQDGRPPAALPRGELHLWRIMVEEGERAADHPVLSPEEQARAGRFLRAADRSRFVEARTALRTILSRYTGIAPKAVELRAGKHGKPELAPETSPRAVQFNVTHSGGVVLLAFAVGTPVGIDVEALRPIPEVGALADRYLTAAERRDLEASRDRSAGFLRLWTLKEAYLKATGDGIGALEAVEVSASPSGARIVEPRTGWAAHLLEPARGYVAALVHPISA